jgi:sulfatase modifying factor 1
VQKSVFILGLALAATGTVACSGNDTSPPLNPPSDGGADVTVGDGSSEGDAAPPEDGEVADAADAGDAGCSSGATQCLFNGVEECSAGSWGSPVPCPASTPECSNGVCGQPSSCQTSVSGTANCGPDGASESCCTSLEVTGGTYYRTYTNLGDDAGATGEADPATVSGFRLDKYLVTVGRFRQFVNAVLLPDGGLSWTPPTGSGKHTHLNSGAGLAAAPNVDAGQTYEPGWSGTTADDANVSPTYANLVTNCFADGQFASSTWTSSASGGQENLPINCATWQEAYAFCIWDGGFLPSESEWEYAAAGGSEQLEVPWGTATPGTVCPGTGCEYAIDGCYYPNGPGGCTGVANIAPVGYASMGVGRWGQLDLVGDMWEWNLDWYKSSYDDPSTDGVQLDFSSSYRVIRGSAFDYPPASTSSRLGGFNPPAGRSDTIGFRCARTP